MLDQGIDGGGILAGPNPRRTTRSPSETLAVFIAAAAPAGFLRVAPCRRRLLPPRRTFLLLVLLPIKSPLLNLSILPVLWFVIGINQTNRSFPPTKSSQSYRCYGSLAELTRQTAPPTQSVKRASVFHLHHQPASQLPLGSQQQAWPCTTISRDPGSHHSKSGWSASLRVAP